jgi:hypothetical protein
MWFTGAWPLHLGFQRIVELIERFDDIEDSVVRALSGLPPVANKLRTSRIGSFVPKAEVSLTKRI